MKKYKHKITGDYVEQSNESYYKLQSDGRTIPTRLIESSQDWELIKQNWVITAFRDKGEIHKLVDFKTYFPYQAMGGDMVLSYDYAISAGKEIFSVRRSDGVEFKVGDNVQDVNYIGHVDYKKYPFVIKMFEIRNDCMYLISESDHYFQIDFAQHSPAVLFTTHDGVEITDKEAAEAYIAEHKPLYSIADIRKAWGAFRGGVDDFVNELKQVK